MDLIRSKSCLLDNIAHAQYGGSAVFRMKSAHRCGTLVKLSAWLCSDLTRTASTDSSYSLTKLVSGSSQRLISILLVTLVCTKAFRVRVSVIHLCTQAESVWRCSIVAFQINAMFTPFSTASSSAKFMCYVSLSFRNQLASSTAAQSCSSDTPVARKLAPTQTSSSGSLTHYFPRTGSSWRILAMTSFIIVVKGTSITLSSQPFVMSAALRLMNAAATLDHLTIGKSPTRLRRVKMCGTLGTLFPRSHINVLPSPRTVSPSTRAPFSSRSGSLLAGPKLDRCCLTLVAKAIFSLMKTLSIYAKIAYRIVSYFESVASTIALMIDGATLSPKPIHVKQPLQR